MRIASIHLPSFSLQAAIAAAPAGLVQPVAIVDAASPVVTACSRAAWARGVRPGMVASVARNHAPELVTLVRDPAGEATLLRSVAEELMALTPVVDLGGAPRGQHHAMLVEVPTGKRGAAFGARLVEVFERRGLHVRVGIADDRFTAGVAATAGEGDGAVTCVPRGGSAAFLAPQPLALLALPAEVQHMLECLGVRTLGDFADLPPPSVARAWDADLQALARGDSGARLDPYVPHAELATEAAIEPAGEPLLLTAVPSFLGQRPEHRRTRRGKQRPRIAPGQARLFS